MTSGTFFRSRWVDPPEGTVERDPTVLAPGFRSGGASAGIKGEGELDLGLVVCDQGAETESAIMLTTNAVAAAAVRLCRAETDRSAIGAVVVTSGNANCATGPEGDGVAREIREAAARSVGLEPGQVAIAQTGVIGVPLDPQPVLASLPGLAKSLDRSGGSAFAEAIMTTDAGPKHCSVELGGVTISAQAKGAGMIEPGLATMLCFVQTDAVVADAEAELGPAVDRSFNRISVDGQMSTNDTVLLQASGRSGRPLPEGLLDAVMLQLALGVLADGEGSSRIARVDVRGARDVDEADRVSRAVANSALVKTALFGRDPNWGRILQAAGAALEGEDLGDIGPGEVEAEEMSGRENEVAIGLELGRGTSSAYAYFSDLTYRYIEINAEYTT